MSQVSELICHTAPAQQDYATRVRLAVASVFAEQGLCERSFFRAITVCFSAHHWIGRGLSVKCRGLEQALHAFRKLQEARGPQLFAGGNITGAYTREKAHHVWHELKTCFVDLQATNGCLQRT